MFVKDTVREVSPATLSIVNLDEKSAISTLTYSSLSDREDGLTPPEYVTRVKKVVVLTSFHPWNIYVLNVYAFFGFLTIFFPWRGFYTLSLVFYRRQ